MPATRDGYHHEADGQRPAGALPKQQGVRRKAAQLPRNKSCEKQRHGEKKAEPDIELPICPTADSTRRTEACDTAKKPSMLTSRRVPPGNTPGVRRQASPSECNRSIEVAHAFVGRSLMQELAGEEVKVPASSRQMWRKSVLQGDARLISHKPRRAEIPWANLHSIEIVESIVNRAAPIERHFGRYGRLGIESYAHERADIGKV